MAMGEAASRADALGPNQIVVIYDGTCGLCSNIARWMTRLDWRRALVWLPSQAAGVTESARLTPTDVAEAAWAVAPDGTKQRGAAAISMAVDQLWPRGTPVFAALYRLPGLHGLADAGYRWLALNRHRIPGAPACGLNRTVPPLDAATCEALARRMRRVVPN
jgi:predicted DCC family thiol-disulfide oxidoreductase YuxK